MLFMTKFHLALLAYTLAAAAVSASSTRGYDEKHHSKEARVQNLPEEDPRRVLAPAPAVLPFVEWSTSVDIYLDPDTSGGANTPDTRFDLSSAVNRLKNDDGSAVVCGAPGTGLRDFIFHCGWYAAPNRWLCNTSNNSVGDPKSAGNVEIPGKDWYTFTQTFKNVGGVLSVDFEILKKSTNAIVKQWTRSQTTPPADTIDKVGGSRYHWFVTLGCTAVDGTSGECTTVDSAFKLPIDNSKRCIKGFGCDFFQGFEVDTAGWFDNSDVAGFGDIGRVATITNMIPSATGGFHALVGVVPNDPESVTGPYTNFSGRCISYAEDQCCGTAEGAIVDVNGCSDEDVDEDGDGVCNLDAPSKGPNNLCVGVDLCPGTPALTPVNDIGCSDDQKETICKSKKAGGKGKSTKAPTKGKGKGP